MGAVGITLDGSNFISGIVKSFLSPPGVGDVQGDQGRNANGSALVVTGTGASGSGALYHPGGASEFLTGQGTNNARFSSLSIDLSRVMPVGPAFAPRRWGALACAYLGRPAS